eukprot:6205560-Pleurochrysis_carterae.AAC.3
MGLHVRNWLRLWLHTTLGRLHLRLRVGASETALEIWCTCGCACRRAYTYTVQGCEGSAKWYMYECYQGVHGRRAFAVVRLCALSSDACMARTWLKACVDVCCIRHNWNH